MYYIGSNSFTTAIASANSEIGNNWQIPANLYNRKIRIVAIVSGSTKPAGLQLEVYPSTDTNNLLISEDLAAMASGESSIKKTFKNMEVSNVRGASSTSYIEYIADSSKNIICTRLRNATNGSLTPNCTVTIYAELSD